MNPKIKSKKRNPKIKNIIDEGEIIEIGEFPEKKVQIKSQNKYEITEITSSESTTPNKKDTKKKKADHETHKIMDIEIPLIEEEKFPKHKKGSALEQNSFFVKKKSVDKLIRNNKKTKKERQLENLINRIITREKSPKVKKEKNKAIDLISLDESDNDIQAANIKEIEEVRIISDDKNKASKTKRRKKDNKIKDFSKNYKNKKKVKNDKDKKIEINEDIIQCHLSSSEDDEEEIIKKNNSSIQIKTENNIMEMAMNSSDNSISANKNFLKDLKKNKENIVEKGEDEKKPNIKRRDNLKEVLREKMYNLLGKKRKNDTKKIKSKTPNKNLSNSQTLLIKIPPKIPSEKKKSKTPTKNIQKDEAINIISKMNDKEKNSSKNDEVPELTILNQLIKEYGFEKVINTLCKSKLDQNTKLDSCLKGLKDSCSESQLYLILFNVFFYYFNSKMEEIKSANKKAEYPKTSIIKKYFSDLRLKNFSQKSQANEIKPVEANINENDEIKKMQIEHEEVQQFQSNNKNEKIKVKKEKNPLKEESKKVEKKTICIGSHYNKDEDGKIYKYQVSHLDGKGNAIFRCYDDNCNGTGIYELETKKFSVNKNHDLKHEEHDYILNYDKDGEEIIKELINNQKSNAQVFKENDERTYKIY